MKNLMCSAFLLSIILTLGAGEVTAQDSSDFKEMVATATNGDAEAQYRLGMELADKYPQASLSWIKRAAENGFLIAQYRLAERLILDSQVQKSESVVNEALYWYRQAASKDFLPAQKALGYLYSLDDGIVAKDDLQSARWYTKAAWQGDRNAQYSIGRRYLQGLGVSQDINTGISWITKSAQQDFAPAQSLLGSLYFSGEIIERDYGEAARWFQTAALLGDAHAQYAYGIMLLKGIGMQSDISSAIRLFRVAAEQGYGPGQLALGEQFLRGEGVQQSFIEAYKWLVLALLSGEESAQKLLMTFVNKMSPEQVDEAKTLIRQWQDSTSAKS